MTELQTALIDCPFVAFDFETTGLSASQDRALELGAVRFSLRSEQCSSYSQLYHPQQSIPEEVICIHGITDDMVQDAPLFADALPELLAFFDQQVLVAHHAAFDLAFLASEFRRAGQELLRPIVVDSFHLARRVLPGAPSYGLSALMQHLELEMGQAHRALPDAEACARLFKALIQRIPAWQELSLQDLLTRYPQARVGLLESDAFNPTAQHLFEAIAQNKRVLIAYRNSRGERLERPISPLLLGGFGHYSYVEAYCHLRQQNRQFRLNRIQEIQSISEDADSEATGAPE